ncbi:hypothetical protein D3C77_603940 [compost metagenome]
MDGQYATGQLADDPFSGITQQLVQSLWLDYPHHYNINIQSADLLTDYLHRRPFNEMPAVERHAQGVGQRLEGLLQGVAQFFNPRLGNIDIGDENPGQVVCRQ